MPDDERAPSILQAIEEADTPLEAMSALGKLSLRRLVELPLEVGREIWGIVRHTDPAEMTRGVNQF